MEGHHLTRAVTRKVSGSEPMHENEGNLRPSSRRAVSFTLGLKGTLIM